MEKEKGEDDNSTDEMEITEAMIDAAAEVLMSDPSLDYVLGPTGAEVLAEKILVAALSLCHQRTPLVDR